MLIFFTQMGDNKEATLTSEIFIDINWFCTFLKQFNGVVYYDLRSIKAELYLEACLTGLGGIFDNQSQFQSIFTNTRLSIWRWSTL